MTTTLTGEVGKSGRAEDVAIVQALLANIKGPDGRSFWDRRIDGRPGAELAAAIAAFQKAYEVASYQRSRDEGVVRPGLVTWNTLVSVFPLRLGELRAVAGNPLTLYATKNPGAVAGETADRLRRGATARERTIGQRLRPELAQAVENVAATTGVGLILGDTMLAEDRVAMSFQPVGLSVLDGYGRPQSVDARQGDVPAALWREVDRVMTARAAVEATGRGGYRPRDGLPTLRNVSLDTALLTRFGMSPSTIRGDRRPVLAALTLIARANRPSPIGQDELTQLIDIVAADDPETARALTYHRRRHALAGQPEEHGTGPSPFEQAVDQLLRTIRRNYQSSQFVEVRSLVSNSMNPGDVLAGYLAFKALVGNRKPWDIKREFPRWVRDPVDGVEYGSDLWGNFHYGYLGRAAGIRLLLFFAARQQFLSYINNDPDLLEEAWIVVRELFETWDDPKDQAAIRLGIAMWDEHRFPLPRGALLAALRRHRTELNTR